MRKLTGILVLIILFIVAVYAAFLFYEEYQKAIRYLYITLSKRKISFTYPKKYFDFASGEFVISFGLFVTTFCFLLYRQATKKRLITISLSLVLFVVSIVTHCYFGALFKLVECTACADGTRKLRYDDLNYDFIFISALAVAILPSLITALGKRINKSRIL